MNGAGFTVRGWCPGALRPMASGDGLIARIRAPLNRLSPGQARGLARAARDHGNGAIDLSARANLQLRGIAPERHDALLADLRALGLVDGDATREAKRNLVVTPFADGTEPLAQAIEDGLADAPPLPGKFGAVLDCGPVRVMADISGDIRIERDETGRLLLRADGAATGRPIEREDVTGKVAALAAWFVAAGGVRDGRGRMRDLIARGVRLPADLAGDARPAPAAEPPGPGAHDLGFLAAIEFGRLGAETLDHLAAQSRGLRLTPWRMILIEGGGAPGDAPGLIRDPGDARLRVSACTGAPGCPQAFAPVRDLARALAPRVPPQRHLHVSGCAKGCAHPGPADLTLTAGAGGFALIRRGRAGDPPLRLGLSPQDLIQDFHLPFEAP
ncbi:precorrin-3B synthase [Zavarzinia compransoris]|uniref:precorrin-3B synthase n=1 Tax=Zavarzinia marina TaxID=2911065 RepID=UPI001F3DF2EA|nr:precorrin-3B synthase [Zavarzinia marina]MCF4167384.1 precorrin-3B synthase [Zavarzinia marina]